MYRVLPVKVKPTGPTVRTLDDLAALPLYSLPDDDPTVAAAVARAVTTVMIDQPDLSGVPYVGHDDRNAARLALAHLLELGHRRIGVLGYRLTPQRHRGELPRELQL